MLARRAIARVSPAPRSKSHALLRQARKALKEETGESLDDDRFIAMLARRVLQGAGEGPRHQIAVTKCDQCKRAFQDGGGAVLEIAKDALETAECTAEHIDQDGVITRHIPEATRRAVRRRDHGRCRVPWCRSTGDLHEHHIERFARGGKHEKDNLITMCWSHHRDLHAGSLRLEMENGQPKFTRAEPPTRVAANDTDPRARPSPIVEQAVRSLMVMGFKKWEATLFVESAIAHTGKDVTLKDLLHEALRQVPTKR